MRDTYFLFTTQLSDEFEVMSVLKDVKYESTKFSDGYICASL